MVDETPAGQRPPVSFAALAGAFGAVVVGGLCGALIGYGLVDIDCQGNCDTPMGIGAVVGGLFGAVGVAVVAVLVLRAFAEWRAGGARRS
ncbi:MAG: hypothetical protein M3357_09840 [Actinomycetota bacterium]|nr:hypothetical protein [Actinomycetota bacterium]